MSSAQGANSTTITTDYQYKNVNVRDSSDYTRRIREQISYVEFYKKTSAPAVNNPISPGNTENPWIPYGNQFRLSYLFGKLKCTTCTGNAFVGNGPYANNVGGIDPS